ncbi:hypothetical protein DUY81_09350 [Acidipropionibacterium acidipropionici]|uniref:Uncharacterized protein n=1 Tax=Acidipropionibacterium acidipropionici TaxID=1748 RepID=A0AAC8YD15_9ACTN|nr:hypothetical protein [Acidipropionibacterium acidipropionici]AMS04506.1 hypothetical protein AXH35_02440 [Acidipropionibacterium acidipropionici]AOZ45999.1 hypothetical protein A8L58_03905 [Acidipropionibacterium acidipropionici]AZP37978.1 hypothetical protein DUY81_09350 [Acidipropionibacterium acidipropionici]
MRQVLTERRDLSEARADAILDQALTEHQSWTTALGTPPSDERAAAAWRRLGCIIAAYRDRYNITGPVPLGAPAESTAQKIDAARARTALDQARRITDAKRDELEPTRGRTKQQIAPTL